MTNPLLDLSVAARFAARSFAQRLSGEYEPGPDLDLFESEMEAAIAALPSGTVRSHQWLTLPANEPPWRDTGIDVAVGAHITYFAAGRAYASRPLDIWIAPRSQIWTRIGEKGDVFSSTRNSNTLPREQAGRLFFGNYFPNDWADRTGTRLQDDSVYASVSGENRIVVIEWGVSETEGLATLLREADPLGVVSSEVGRREDTRRPPEDWHYLWHLGESEIYDAGVTSNGAPCIDCDVKGDVGILQKEVDFPITPDTEISWSWIVDALPGLLREDTVPSHDYLSIAVEFDNGWDITYYWSKALPEETGYVCPLPNWKHREYHVVVRSGYEGLGESLAERRNLHDDFERYMSSLGESPTRVVRVWLIAVSVFQRQQGRCSFSDIRLHEGDRELVVL